MSPLEDELRKMLRRKEPAPGFSERVMSALREAPPRPAPVRRILGMFRRQAWRWAAVTAMVGILAGVGWVRYQRQQRLHAQAEQAGREAILALRITTTEMNVALERAERATERALVAKNPSGKWGD